jgi:hypothetical protein
MPETVIYRGPNGTTVDVSALEAALEAQDMVLSLSRDAMAGKVRVPTPTGLESHFEYRQVASPSDDPCRAEIHRRAGTKSILLDAEEFPAFERVEGIARLLRRVLPNPSEVIAHMSAEAF